jgi:hypothetical protein
MANGMLATSICANDLHTVESALAFTVAVTVTLARATFSKIVAVIEMAEPISSSTHRI